MLRGFFGNLILAIIARMLCGNHVKSTREAGVARGYRLMRLLHFSCAKQLPRISITRRTHANHEPIVNYIIIFFDSNGAEQVAKVMQGVGCE